MLCNPWSVHDEFTLKQKQRQIFSCLHIRSMRCINRWFIVFSNMKQYSNREFAAFSHYFTKSEFNLGMPWWVMHQCYCTTGFISESGLKGNRVLFCSLRKHHFRLTKYQVVKVSPGGSFSASTVFWGCFLGVFSKLLYEGILKLGYKLLSTLIWLLGIIVGDRFPTCEVCFCSCCLSRSWSCPDLHLATGPVWCPRRQVEAVVKIGGRGRETPTQIF